MPEQSMKHVMHTTYFSINTPMGQAMMGQTMIGQAMMGQTVMCQAMMGQAVNVNVTDTILWQGHPDRVMQLN